MKNVKIFYDHKLVENFYNGYKVSLYFDKAVLITDGFQDITEKLINTCKILCFERVVEVLSWSRRQTVEYLKSIVNTILEQAVTPTKIEWAWELSSDRVS